MLRYRFPAFSILWLVWIVILPACNQTEEVEELEAVYFDYIIWGDEESGKATIKLQYRANGPGGRALQLTEPARVEFDGMVLVADSARYNGTFYDIIWPVVEFGGTHQIVFTDFDGKKYKTSFEFPVVSLKTEIPEIISRNNLVLELEGMNQDDRMRILLTDTSFYGRGIEKIDTVKEGHVVISTQDLADLKNGPIHLELFREKDQELQETTPAGGRLWMFYSLKREFILQDSLN